VEPYEARGIGPFVTMGFEGADRSEYVRLPSLPMSHDGDSAPLPLPLTRFFGRKQEIAAAAAQLSSGEARLLALVGPGGVGKTRLALQLAAIVQDRLPHRAVFVPLSSLRDPALVLPTLVLALGIEGDEGADPAARLRAFLQQRKVLLVLDNLEQVITAGSALGELLVASPGLSMLVTSRIPLRVSGEQVVPVAPLPVPAGENGADGELAALAAAPAIALFVDRAVAALPTFALTARNVNDVVTICRHADGLPLAIELAAARLRVLSPGELAARLDPRLPYLTGGPRDRPDRLQTMRNAIAWSYDLLEPAQQALFRWLSVFVGGFGIAAVEHVAAALPVGTSAVDLLGGIVDASLVQRGDGPDGEARFTMLETIREFGLERLIAAVEEEAARRAHASWCVTFAEVAGPNLSGPNHLAWWNRVESELANIRAAHTWLVTRGDAEWALRLGTALAWFWSVPGLFTEGRVLFHQLVEMPEARSWPALLARTLNAAGSLEHWLDNLDSAETLYRRQLALSRDLSDTPGIVSVLRALGSIAIDRSDLNAASQSLAEGQTLISHADVAWDAAAIANLLGIVAFGLGQYEEAVRRSEEAIRGWQAIDDTGHVAAAQVNQARAWLASGDYRRSAVTLSRVLEVVEADVGDDIVTADCFDVAAGIATTTYDATNAAHLLAAADVMFARMGVLRRPPFQAFADRLIAETHLRLGDAAFADAWDQGGALALPDAIDIACAVAVAARPGQPAAKAPTTGPAALTVREREVLRLIAGGHSDKEIALALGITRFTASNHVSNIRTKLGVPSRAAVAALAVRDGLL
jgi:predicted ATPase/DNA-binding CsgD family transcriptional regulator